MTDTNKLPTFGPQRNAALAELMGWTNVIIGRNGEWSSGNPPGTSIPLRVECTPDYCGWDAACFGLLAELANDFTVSRQNSGGKSIVQIYTGLCCYHAASPLPNEREALRDATTAAAWQALTAQKERANE